MFPPVSLLSIFVSYPKEKMKENDLFFLKNFGYAWGKWAAVPQGYEYPKSIWYGYGFIFGVSVLHRYDHLWRK